MQTIKKEWLKEKRACQSGVKWFLAQDETNAAKVMLKLVDEDRASDALWILEKTMNKKQSVQLAVFSARLCLENFEKAFPDNDRPRKAIEAAEAYSAKPCSETKVAAISAATLAILADGSAENSAFLAARSAHLAILASFSSRYALLAVYSAMLAVNSVCFAAEHDIYRDADHEKRSVQTKIIDEAIKIMGI